MGVIAPHSGSHPAANPAVQLGHGGHSVSRPEPIGRTTTRGSRRSSVATSETGLIPGLVSGVTRGFLRVHHAAEPRGTRALGRARSGVAQNEPKEDAMEADHESLTLSVGQAAKLLGISRAFAY